MCSRITEATFTLGSKRLATDQRQRVGDWDCSSVDKSRVGQLLRCDRQVAYALAGRVIDGVGYCGCHRNGSQFDPRPSASSAAPRASEADLR
jgi:hypothetical protein